MENEENIPGAAGVIRIHGGNAFYCTMCGIEIQPLIVEVEGEEIPCCENCTLKDILDGGGEIKQGIEVAPLEEDKLQRQEDELWEFYT